VVPPPSYLALQQSPDHPLAFELRIAEAVKNGLSLLDSKGNQTVFKGTRSEEVMNRVFR
jgi:hypothetical protein